MLNQRMGASCSNAPPLPPLTPPDLLSAQKFVGLSWVVAFIVFDAVFHDPGLTRMKTGTYSTLLQP